MMFVYEENVEYILVFFVFFFSSIYLKYYDIYLRLDVRVVRMSR
jgi:hypothetical protein